MKILGMAALVTVVGAILAGPGLASCFEPFGDVSGDNVVSIVDVQCELLTVLEVLGSSVPVLPDCFGALPVAADLDCADGPTVGDVVLLINRVLEVPPPAEIDANGDGCPDACEPPCTPNPCRNGGTCVDENPGYSCECSAAFGGLHCEVGGCGFGAEFCDDGDPCTTGDMCVGASCVPGQSTCFSLFDECGGEVPPCAGDGVCKDTADGYVCSCSAESVGDGWTCTSLKTCNSDGSGCTDSPADACALDPSKCLVTSPGVTWGTLCVRIETEYADAGVGEDYWTATTPWMRAAKGLRYTAYQAPDAPFGLAVPINTGELYLGDGQGDGDPGAGCMNLWLVPGAYYTVKLFSEANVNTNLVRVLDRRGSEMASPPALATWWTSGEVYTSGGELTLDVVPTGGTDVMKHNAFNVLMAAAHGIWARSGGVFGATYTVWANDNDYPGSSAYQASQDIVHIRTNHWDEKFLILHEMAHAVYRKATGWNKQGATSCQVHGVDPRCQNFGGSGDAGHQLPTYEYSSCAFFEGFAHFYAAAVFNDPDPSQFAFGYYRDAHTANFDPLGSATPDIADNPVVGILPTSDYPLAFGQTICEAAQPTSTRPRGTEVDWMRALWEIFALGTDESNVGAILDWVAAADMWDPEGDDGEDVVAKLTAAVPPSLVIPWISAQIKHGLD